MCLLELMHIAYLFHPRGWILNGGRMIIRVLVYMLIYNYRRLSLDKEKRKRLNGYIPNVMSLDFLYRPCKGFVIQIGPGLESERHKDYLLMRTGIEYEFEFHGDGPKYGAWDISPMLFYYHRLKANDTRSLGLGIGRRF